MSLVNDMLRDLASQQQGEPHTRRNSDDLLLESSLLKKSQSSWLPSFLVFVVVLIGLLAIQKGWLNRAEESSAVIADTALATTQEQKQKQKQEQAQTLVVVAEHEPVTEQNSKALAVIAEASTPDLALETSLNSAGQQPQIITSEVSRLAQATELSGRIYKLIHSAERAIAADRLTSPIEDNAYRYYQEVLQLSPQNAVAQEGLQAIAQRYVNLAEESITQADPQRVEILLARAAFVVPDYPAITRVRRQLEGMTENLPMVNQPVQDFPLQLQPENKNTLSYSDGASAPASVAVTSLAVAEASADNLSVKPNAAWQDQQAAAQAEQMLTQGQTQAAQVFLQQFIAGHPQPVKTTQTLFNLYLQQSDQDAARVLLQQARNYLPELVQTHLTAQLLLAQGNPAAAISALEKNIQQAEDDEAYRALLAGLYHQTARYQESASSYRRLLDVFGEKPAYWLGLALGLDALQQNTSALEAYRRIPVNQALPPKVKDYVEQRIAALSQ